MSFDGFKAVTDVDLTVLQGDLRFLIGPNGAGKTTLIDAITGLVPATGSAQKTGVELLGKKVHQIARLGVGRTFQTASVFEQLSVLQNLDIAAGAGRSALTMLRRRKSVLPAIEEALETTGLADLRDKPAGVLAHGQKQWLEIGMLLVQNASVLLLDEPVAGMSAEEREETGNLLRRIGGDRVVVVVEHDMDFMRAFASSVTVLAGGTVLSEGPSNRSGGSEGPRGLSRHRRGGRDRTGGRVDRTCPAVTPGRRQRCLNSPISTPATAAPR